MKPLSRDVVPVPPALRYRLVRLRAISRHPAVWGSLAALGLLAVVGPQYLRHPEWLSQYDPAADSAAVAPDTEVDALSNAELADLAEIDNLALLLNQIQPTTATALAPPSADAAAPPAATADQAPTGPFAQYLERNRFRFSPAPGGQPEGTAIAPWAVATDQSRPLSGAIAPESFAPESLPPSALQQALNQAAGPESEAGTQPAPEPADGGSEMTPPPWMVEGSLEGRLPGVDQRFMRTTPQMSPPPGTTGYTLPPSLVPSPALPSPGSVAPAPAALNLDLDAPVVAPLGSVQGAAQPGAGNSVSAPSPQPVPPFSAPRPPGVYTGNGYINTFSDPSGPID